MIGASSMTIIEYKLDPQDQPRSYHPKTVPDYVSDGGYWFNLDNEKMIGVGLEGSIPESISTFNLAELQARQRAIHEKYPMKKIYEQDNLDADDMTDDEVDAFVKVWWDAR